MKKIFTLLLLAAFFSMPRSAQAVVWEVSDGTQVRINPDNPGDPTDLVTIPAGTEFMRPMCGTSSVYGLIVVFEELYNPNSNISGFCYTDVATKITSRGYKQKGSMRRLYGPSMGTIEINIPDNSLRFRLVELVLGYNAYRGKYNIGRQDIEVTTGDSKAQVVDYYSRIVITREEARAVKVLNLDPTVYNLNNKGIFRINGLEIFENLEELYLQNNYSLGKWSPVWANLTELSNSNAFPNFKIFSKLKILDLSKTVPFCSSEIYYNPIECDISFNDRLPLSIEKLIYKNAVPSSSYFSSFRFHNTSCIYSITITGFPNLKYLDLSGNITAQVDCSNNPSLQTLYLPSNEKLTQLRCQNGAFTGTLDLSSFPYLTHLQCQNNNITAISFHPDVSMNLLKCQNNNLISLNVPGSFRQGSLTLFTYKVPAYERTNWASNYYLVGTETLLDCSGNSNLSSLTLPNARGLKKLYCQDCNLSALDLSACSNLEILNVRNNSLSTLNLANSPLLSELYCQDNGMSTLTLSSDNKALTRLECQRNNIQTLSISNNSVACAPYIDCSDNSPMTNFTLGNASTLYCYNNNNLAALDLSTCTNLERLYMSHTKIPAINLSNCKKLRVLYAKNRIGEPGFANWNHGLTSLDCSGLTKLETVRLSRNKITSLDMSGCSSLQTLTCDNQGGGNDNDSRLLETLNLTGCSNLISLDCQNNALTSLDLSTCTKLLPNGVKGYVQRAIKDVVVLDRDKICIELPNGVTPTVAYNGTISDINMDNYFGTWAASGYDKTRNKVVRREGKTYLVLYDIGDDARGGTQTKYDVDYYGRILKYQYALAGDNWDETLGGSLANSKKNDNVTVTIYPYVMYINPATLDKYTDPQNTFYSGTIYLDYDAVVPPGTEVYIAQGLQLDREGMITGGENTTSGQLNLVKIEKAAGATNVVIPAYTPVYVKSPSETGLFDFARNLNNEPLATIPSGNIFKGTLRDTTVTPYDILTLSRGYKTGGTGPDAQSRVGFWRFNNTLLPAHRVYIEATEMDKVNASGVRGLTFAFFDSEADLPTSIDRMERVTNTIEQQQRGWYTVSGIRLKDRPTAKGVYIHNGKKVFIN